MYFPCETKTISHTNYPQLTLTHHDPNHTILLIILILSEGKYEKTNISSIRNSNFFC